MKFQQQRSSTPDSIRSNSNHLTNNEHQTTPTVDTQQAPTTETNQIPPSTFQQTQMPTPNFAPSGFNSDQQVRTNIFGPPPTTFPGMPSSPINAAPRFPPATTPNSHNPPPSSFGQPSAFIGQPASPPLQQGGFYGQQQGLFQPRPPVTGYNPHNTYPPQQTSTPPSNSSPATINPSYVQPPPPMASQQPYGGYPPQNSYYNPIQPYPKQS
jgi:hypothetical protein